MSQPFVTVDDVQHYVGAPSSDLEFCREVLTEAEALVTGYVGAARIPVSVWKNAVLQTAAELFHRRNAPSGIASFAALDGAVVRVALDPMRSVYAMLDRAGARRGV